MDSSSTLCLILLSVLSYLVAVWWFQKRERSSAILPNKIPGIASSHPLEGNFKEIQKSGSMITFLRLLHKKYGNIVSFFDGPNMAVSVSSPEMLKEMRFLSTFPDLVFAAFHPLTGDECITFMPTDQVLQRRKIYDPFFTSRTCNTFYQCFHEIVRQFTEKWEKLTPEDHIEVSRSMMHATMMAILSTSFGSAYKDQDNLQISLVTKNAQRTMEILGKYPNYMEKDVKELQDIGANQRRFVNEIMEERRKQKQQMDGEQPLLIDLLLEEDISDTLRANDSFVFLLAGFVTSSYLLTHILYFISLYKDIQEKIYQEVRQVLGDKLVDDETMPQLVYMKQVINETLRFIPLAEFVGRVAMEDMTVGGYVIPKGTNIYQNFADIFSDPTIYSNPQMFDPDRFSVERSKGRSPYAFKPFGFAGKRQCPGQSFAYIEVAVFLSEWCKKFTFNLIPRADGGKMNIGHGVVCHMTEEVWISLTHRK